MQRVVRAVRRLSAGTMTASGQQDRDGRDDVRSSDLMRNEVIMLPPPGP